MAKRRASGDVARDSGSVHVAKPVLFVTNVAFFLEDAELGAHGGIAGLIGKLGQDLADGGVLQLIEDVHDLALAAREGDGLGFWFLAHVLFL